MDRKVIGVTYRGRLIGMKYLPIIFYLCPYLFYHNCTNNQSFPQQSLGISCTRGGYFRKYWPSIFDSEYYKDSNELFKTRLLVDGRMRCEIK